jgi:hypothetical protein
LIQVVLFGPSHQRLWYLWLIFACFRMSELAAVIGGGGRPAELCSPWLWSKWNWARLVSQLVYTLSWFDAQTWVTLLALGILVVVECMVWVLKAVGPALRQTWLLVCTLCLWVKLAVVTGCHWVELGLAIYGIGLATAFTWLRQKAPAARVHALRAWGRITRVLWVLVAAALLSFPWQFTILEQSDKGLAFLLPVVQLVLLHLLSWLCNRRMLLAKRLSLHFTKRLVSVHNLLGAAVCLNWCVLSTEAIASGSIYESAKGASTRGVYVPNMRAHVAAHYGLSAVYSVLLVGVHAVVASQAARRKLQFAAALLLWLPKTAAGLVKCLLLTWPLAVARAVGQQVHALCGALLSACYRLGSCCSTQLLQTGEFMRSAVSTPVLVLDAASDTAAAASRHWAQAVRQHALSAPAAARDTCVCMATAAAAAAGALLQPAAHARKVRSVADSQCSGSMTGGKQLHPSPAAAVTAQGMHKQHLQTGCPLHDCVVCLDAPRSVALLPCRHVALCDDCFAGMQRKAQLAGCGVLPCCPMCRAEVQQHVGGLILA